jgi:hypothetical protein
MTCPRCHGFMSPVDLPLWAGNSGPENGQAWRCVACGEIIDQVIVRNRIHTRDRRLPRRQKTPRQPVLKAPAL